MKERISPRVIVGTIHTMVLVILFQIIWVPFVFAGQTPEYAWHTFHKGGGSGNAILTHRASGSIYVAGYSNSSWHGPAGQAPLNPHNGGVALFVLKLDTNGAYLWHTFHGTSRTDGLADSGIAVDDDGNIYVTGSSKTIWKGPTGQLPLHVFSGGEGEDIFVLKLGADGAYKWHTFYGSISIGDMGRGVAVDRTGSVFVAGGSIKPWQGPAGQDPLHAYSGTYSGDAFVLKLTTDGAYEWHTFYGSTDTDDESYAIEVDTNGNVHATGYSNQGWNGDGNAAPLHGHTGWYDAFVLKLSSDGAYTWHTFYGAPTSVSGGDDWPHGIAVDGTGNVFVAGASNRSWKGAGGKPPLQAFHEGSEDIFVLKLDMAGAYKWHAFYGSTGFDRAFAIGVDSAGSAHVTGTSEKTWNGAGGASPTYPFSSWSYDAFILKLGANGAYRWHAFYGETAQEEGHGIAVDGKGNVFTVGFGGGWKGPSEEPPLYAGGSVWVLKMADSMPVVTTTALSGITATTATAEGDVLSDGGRSVTARGTCRGLAPWPTLADKCTTNGSGVGQFASALTGLVQNTTYHARAYATNAAGTAYGDDVEFTTSATASKVNLRVNKSGTGAGTVSGTGGLSCTVYPCLKTYSVGTQVTIAGVAHVGSTFGGWSSGEGSAGSCEGPDPCTFTISADSSLSAGFSLLPVVETAGVTAITSRTATGGGTVTFAGGEAVTARGICWGSSSNPTKADTCTNDGTGTGKFTSTLTGLAPAHTYHARAYATNTVVTAYGDDIAFRTKPRSVLTITKQGAGHGDVAANNGTITWNGNTGKGVYDYKTSVKLTATPAVDSTFAGWTGCDSANGATCTVAMTASKAVAAAFNVRTSMAGGWTDLGTLGGGTIPYGVSADGSVAVGGSQNGSSIYRAFRWAKSGGMMDLGTLGGTTAQAYGVSADGKVVVGAANDSAGHSRAFRWTESGGMADLGTLGGTTAYAYGVSQDGTVVVGRAANSSGVTHAFRWTQADGMTDLGTLEGPTSFAWSVSSDGSVIVGASDSTDGKAHAFRWTEPGGMVDLGTLGLTYSYSYGTSANGAIVVGQAWNGATDGTTVRLPFKWTSGLGMSQIGTSKGSARGVSANGSVVVGSTMETVTTWHAFRWTQKSATQTVNEWLAGNGVETTGIDFFSVNAVSPDGNVLAGQLSTGHGFIAYALPAITLVQPDAGPVGTTVTVHGKNFGTPQGRSTVKFNGKAVTSYAAWSDTQIVCKVPAGATTGPVKVVNAQGASNILSFTVPARTSSPAPLAGQAETAKQPGDAPPPDED